MDLTGRAERCEHSEMQTLVFKPRSAGITTWSQGSATVMRRCILSKGHYPETPHEFSEADTQFSKVSAKSMTMSSPNDMRGISNEYDPD